MEINKKTKTKKEGKPHFLFKEKIEVEGL